MTDYVVVRMRVMEKVSDYLKKNAESTGVPYDLMMDSSSRNHIISTGASILLAKWKVGPEPGGFVKSVVNNDLSGAINTSDEVNRQVLPFYVTMMNNIDINPNEN